MNQQGILSDFTAGELSPRFMGRFDLETYYKGAAEMTNWIPLLPGGATFRPGLIRCGSGDTFKGSGANRVRLHNFTIRRGLSYCLEIGAGYIRFWKAGQLLKYGGTPIEVSTPYTLADLPNLMIDQDANVLVLTVQTAPIKILTMTATDAFTFASLAVLGNSGQVPFLPTTDARNDGNWPAACAFMDGRLYLANTINSPTGIWASEPNDYANFTFFDTIATTSKQLREPAYLFTGNITSGSNTVSGVAAADIANFKVGDRITGTGIPNGNAEADRTFIQSIGASSIVLTKNATATQAGASLTQGWHDPLTPEYQTVTTYRDVITDSNAFKMKSRGDPILWLAATNDLIVGTASGERIVPSGTNPNNLSCKKQSAYGSAPVQPFMLNEAILFVDGNRKGIREYFYDSDSASYLSPALSFTADHILAGLVRETDYQNTPLSIAWYTAESGEAIGCVYAKIYGMRAWFRLTTPGGLIESIVVCAESTEDVFYASVNRSGVRSMERLGTIGGTEGHLDASATATKSAGGISGISWITGAAAVVYAGKSYPITISGGSAALPSAIPDGATVLVGLPFTGTIASMPVNSQTPLGTGHMRQKVVPRIIARVLASYPFKAGPDATAAHLEKASFTGPYTGDWPIPFMGQWDSKAQIYIVQDEPLDATVLALAYDLDQGG